MKKWFDEKVKPWFTKEKWIETLKSIPEAFKQSFRDGVNISINFMNKLIDGIEDMVNNAIDGFSELVNSLNPLSTVLDFVGISFDVKDIDLPNIPMYEVGGYPKSASLFWANENGVPELVGNIGNQTAVASGTEITGISTAIYDTAQEEMALLREQNNLLMELLRKDMSVNIGDREIARANVRGQKSLGYALIT